MRAGQPADLPHLADIERSAAKLFAPWQLDELFASTTTPVEAFERALERNHLLVSCEAAQRPVGFALLSPIDGHLHLDEIDVMADYGRRGHGTALMQAAFALARREPARRITLVTMRDIPFNGPWYTRLGFSPVGEASMGPQLRALWRQERRVGPMQLERVVLGADIG